MKYNFFIILKRLSVVIISVLVLQSCVNKNNKIDNINLSEPRFSNFVYEGNDEIYNDNPLPQGHFYSPILQGCYPDPSITKKGNDYYLVNSSFVMFPGVPIFHSNDLVNWTQIGHVLDRESQLKVYTSGISEGIYAPVIRYNQYNDTFYMITTQFAAGIGNMIVKTKDPKAGNWSDPIKLNFEGIDPSIFFDDNGKAYIVHNDAPDQGKELYQGHRVIKIWEYDIENDQVIAGTDKIIVNGGVDIRKKPIWIEAPHIYKRNNKYYLMCAEGGTADDHSEVIFVSDHARGPYLPAKENPILSQRHLDKTRKNPVEWAGHADIVEGPDGGLYGVFLAIRPNENNRVNTGRETFILPVDWSGDFPIFKGGLEPLKPYIPMPSGVENKIKEGSYFHNGNFAFEDNFSNKLLDHRWVALRGPRESFVNINSKSITIKPYDVNLKQKKPISALFHRQQHTNFSATVSIDFKPTTEKDLAGITCLQSENFHYVLGITKSGDDDYIVLERTQNAKSSIIASKKINLKETIKLKVQSKDDKYEFSFALDNKNFELIGAEVSGDILSTNIAGGFTGALIGLYATKNNDIIIN